MPVLTYALFCKHFHSFSTPNSHVTLDTAGSIIVGIMYRLDISCSASENALDLVQIKLASVSVNTHWIWKRKGQQFQCFDFRFCNKLHSHLIFLNSTIQKPQFPSISLLSNQIEFGNGMPCARSSLVPCM